MTSLGKAKPVKAPAKLRGKRFKFIAEQGAPLRGAPCFSDRRRLRRDLLYDQAVGNSSPLISSAQ